MAKIGVGKTDIAALKITPGRAKAVGGASVEDIAPVVNSNRILRNGAYVTRRPCESPIAGFRAEDSQSFPLRIAELADVVLPCLRLR